MNNKEKKLSVKINWALIISIVALTVSTFFNVQSLNRSNEQLKFTQQERRIRFIETQPQLIITKHGSATTDEQGDQVALRVTFKNIGKREAFNFSLKSMLLLEDSSGSDMKIIDTSTELMANPFSPESELDYYLKPERFIAGNNYYIIFKIMYEDKFETEIIRLEKIDSLSKAVKEKHFFFKKGRFSTAVIAMDFNLSRILSEKPIVKSFLEN